MFLYIFTVFYTIATVLYYSDCIGGGGGGGWLLQPILVGVESAPNGLAYKYK